jgi:hypothetical protein
VKTLHIPKVGEGCLFQISDCQASHFTIFHVSGPVIGRICSTERWRGVPGGDRPETGWMQVFFVDGACEICGQGRSRERVSGPVIGHICSAGLQSEGSM